MCVSGMIFHLKSGGARQRHVYGVEVGLRVSGTMYACTMGRLINFAGSFVNVFPQCFDDHVYTQTRRLAWAVDERVNMSGRV